MLELIKIQATLKAPKAHRNNFGGYNYRSCEDILEALKPLCASHGCFVNIFDEIVEVGDRIYVKATATIFNSEGKSVSSVAFAREEETKKGMDAAQVTGSASSYARKYALNGLFAIDDTRDPDTYEGEKKAETQKSAKQSIDAATLDDKAKCDKLLAWLYSMYEKTSAKDSFNAGVVAEQFYTISEHNKGRLSNLFNSYVQSKKR
jgi:hypothetical protein